LEGEVKSSFNAARNRSQLTRAVPLNRTQPNGLVQRQATGEEEAGF
jgi:hypothetical protein